MRPLFGIVAALGLAAVATAGEARGRDARHYSLPQYDEAAMNGLLAAPNYDTRSLDRIIDQRTAPGGDVVDWRLTEGETDWGGGGVDHWALAWTEAGAAMPGLAGTLARQREDDRFELSYTREWPALLSGTAGDYDFDLSPHAGVGVTNAGHSAEAGAMVRFGYLGKDRTAQLRRRLRQLGMTAADGREFGGRGRWYLFAGASGTSVGVNMLRDPLDGGWRGAGLSSDTTAGFVTSAQAGVAWRQGPAQASVGYIRRKIRIDAPHPELYSSGDDAVAFSFAIKPQE